MSWAQLPLGVEISFFFLIISTGHGHSVITTFGGQKGGLANLFENSTNDVVGETSGLKSLL